MKELNKIESILFNYNKLISKGKTSGKWIKTKKGYTFIQYCNQTKSQRCKSECLLKVHVPSGRAEFYVCNQHKKTTNDLIGEKFK